jgi:UDP-glucose 4-epimerase
MRILVTGGAGFIGSHIVDACLAAGHEVSVVDDLSTGTRANLPDTVPVFVADVGDPARLGAIFDEVQPDAVCHQAAQISVSRSVREPVLDAQVNILGLLQVCTNAVRVGTRRVVFASSGGVLYGDVYTPAKESSPENPLSPYGISKWTCEQYLKFFAREYGIEAVALRYANVYGPRQNPHGEAGVVAIFCQQLLRNEVATIYGDGRCIRDYVYGEDVAQANLQAITAEFPPGFIALNIGTGIQTDVSHLASLILKQVVRERLNSGVNLPVTEFNGDLRANVIDASLAGRLIGWQPRILLANGIESTVSWFRQELDGAAARPAGVLARW